MPNEKQNIVRTNKVFKFLLSALLILVPFFAFISVWTASLVGHFTAVRLWDNVILLVLVLCSLYVLFKSPNLRKLLFQDKLNWLIFCYGLLTILLGVVSYINNDVSVKALFYGLLVNLRYLLLFVAVRLMASKVKFSDLLMQKIVFYPLLLVCLFALLQFFVLPHNFLSHFWYGSSTYPGFNTINQNDSTIRVQSFLRGPNQLGAYLAATICILLAYILSSIKKTYLWLLLGLALASLYLSFSRSALLGAIIGAVFVLFIRLKSIKRREFFIAGAVVVAVILAFGYIAARHNQGVEDLLFHHSNHSTAQITSNEGHLKAFENNIKIVAHDPLGNGPGTSGQASWYNRGKIKNPEDYFMQISEEVGWFGLALFLLILVFVGYKLWQARENNLAIGLLGGLIAITIVCLFTYAWSDDSLSYLWWGMAGLALPSVAIKSKR